MRFSLMLAGGCKYLHDSRVHLSCGREWKEGVIDKHDHYGHVSTIKIQTKSEAHDFLGTDL